METVTNNFVASIGAHSRMGRALKIVGIAALVSGILDEIAAVAVYVVVLGRTSVIGLLQFIASGVFGEAAFTMGLRGAAYGVLFHFTIALGASAVIYAVFNRFPVLRDYPAFTGLAYGGYVWAFMNFIVLPLSNVPQGPFEPGVALAGFVWHMVLVGLPIVLITKRGLEAGRS